MSILSKFNYDAVSDSTLSSSHYYASMRPDQLRKWAKMVARKLPPHLGLHLPIFCYRGMSGTAHVTALTMYWKGDFGMFYARKTDEHTNGNQRFEKSTPHNFTSKTPVIPVFVDDFVASGETRDFVMKIAFEELDIPPTLTHYLCVTEFNITQRERPKT